MSKRSRRERNIQKGLNKKRSKEALRTWQKERGIHDFAEKLREKMPASEVWFLELFKNEGIGIYLNNNIVIGYYIADYVYKNLIIEIDDPTHDNPEQKLKDCKKDDYYTSKGYKVIRVKAWDQTSYNNAIKQIKSYLNNEYKKKKEKEFIQRTKNKRLQDKKRKQGKSIFTKKKQQQRTRELTDYEKRRLDYIYKKKSMIQPTEI